MKQSLFVEFKVKPVPSVCVKVVSWSLPKYITELSAKYKSDHSADAVPKVSPSAEAGSAELAVALDNVPLPLVLNTCPLEPSALGKVQVIFELTVPADYNAT